MVVWLLLIVAIVLQFVIQRRRFTWLPPSSSAMVLGIAAGVPAGVLVSVALLLPSLCSMRRRAATPCPQSHRHALPPQPTQPRRGVPHRRAGPAAALLARGLLLRPAAAHRLPGGVWPQEASLLRQCGGHPHVCGEGLQRARTTGCAVRCAAVPRAEPCPRPPSPLPPCLRTLPPPSPPPSTQVVGTFISALVFGFATYFLVLLGLVRRSHLAGSPFIECLAYGERDGGGEGRGEEGRTEKRAAGASAAVRACAWSVSLAAAAALEPPACLSLLD